MARYGEDKPAAELLRRSLASAAGATDDCPDPEILAAYSEHSLDADESARYELHFSQCARCREQLAAMVLAAAPAPVSRAPRASWILTWGWLGLAPVTAALLIAAIFIARRPSLNHPAESAAHPLVAKLQPSPQPMASAAPQPATEPRAAAPGSFASGGTLQRAAPNSSSEQSQRAPLPLPPKAALSKEAANAYVAPGVADKAASAEAAPAAQPALSSPGNGVGNGRGNGVGNGATAAQPTVMTAVGPPVANDGPVSQGLTDSTASQQEIVQSKQQLSQGPVTNRSVSQNNSLVLETVEDRKAQTIVRSPDPQVLWRISSGRFVARSADAGATWHTQWTNANAQVVAGAATSVETCWLVGRGGIILLTTDGKKWKTVSPPADVDFVNVAATDASSATVTTSEGRQFTTSDRGKHWAPAP
jgi:Photosynthesis system II assembly factor YCF48